MSAENVSDPVPALQRWLPRAATLAALFTTACCIGVPAVVSLVSAVGAGVLVNDRYLQPLLVVTLVITIAASALTYWRHRNPAPLIVTILAGTAIYWFIYRDYLVPIVWIGIVTLVAAQLWDVVAVRSCRIRARMPGSTRTTT